MVDKVEKIWMDGALIPWDAAQVHVLTHTLHYGLGVRAPDGEPTLLQSVGEGDRAGGHGSPAG